MAGEKNDKIETGRKRLSRLIAGSAVAAASLLGASLARASVTITNRIGTRTTSWTEVATTSGESININDATLTNTAATLDRTDAFDDALNVFIGPTTDVSSTGREPALLDAAATVVDNSPNGGTVSGTAAATVNGTDISVDWSLVFASDAARVDGTFVVSNVSPSAFDGYVAVRTDFGSDDDTVIEATSSGNTTFDDADTWVVTSDGGASDNDPVILTVTNRADSLVGPDPTDPINAGSDELIWRVPISLNAGQSTTIVVSHCLFETVPAAIAAGASGSCLVAGAAPTAIPTLQNPGLLALAVLTGLLGAGHLVRRKKVQL